MPGTTSAEAVPAEVSSTSNNNNKTKAAKPFKLSLSGAAKNAPKRLRRAQVSKAAIGVSSQQLKPQEEDVDYVKGIVGNRIAPVNVKKKETLIIPLATNPWEKGTPTSSSSSSSSSASEPPQKKRLRRREPATFAEIPENETEEQRLNREAAAALLKDIDGGSGDEEQDNNTFVIAMAKDGVGEASDGAGGRELSQLERVMAHKKAFEKDEKTGKALTEKEKLQKEMAMRPEHNDFRSEAYEKVEIKDFGRAMLLGMGWKPPEKGKNGEVKAYEAQPRPGRLGLGATSKPWEKKRNDNSSRRIKPGEKRYKAGELETGKTVGIISGPYEGDTGVVLDVIGTSVSVQLENLGRRADQPKRFVTVLDSEEGFRKFHRDHPLKQRNSDSKGSSSSGGLTVLPKGDDSMGARRSPEESATSSSPLRDRPERRHTESRRQDKHHSKKRSKKHKHSHSESSSTSSSRSKMWVRGHIRVRIVSKKVEDGRCYKAKGMVLTVTDPTAKLCSVRLTPGSTVLEDVKQRYLETVLPAEGGEVLVVDGNHAGERGKLLQKSSKSQMAAVQLHDTMEIVKLDYDSVAEFCGRDEWM